MFSFSISKSSKAVYMLVMIFLLVTIFGLFASIVSNNDTDSSDEESEDTVLSSMKNILNEDELGNIYSKNTSVSGSGSDTPIINAVLDSSSNSISTISNAISPQLVVYHTHDCEAYKMTSNSKYDEVGDARTKDQEYSVVAIGKELLLQLNKQSGIRGIQDNTSHEYPKLSTAYARSLVTAKSYSSDDYNPILLDLHRDAYSSRSWDPEYVIIDGERVARIMVVIGKGEGYDLKPNYKANLEYAQTLTDALNEFHPKLAREVKIKDGRYNQHLSEKALLIEIGHHENSLQEALNATKYLAIALEKTFFINP